MVAIQQAIRACERAQFYPQRCGTDWNGGRPTRQGPGQASTARQVSAQCIARVVLVSDPQGYAIVVTPRNRRLELDQLNREFNRRFVRAQPHEIDRLFPTRRNDGLPPLGPGDGIETYLDETLVTVGDVYVETRDGNALVRIEGEAFHELLYGAWCGRFSRAA